MIKSLLHTCLVGLLMMTISACTPNTNTTQDETQAPQIIPFRIIDNGKMSAVNVDKATLYTFHDADSFKNFWLKHVTVTPTPEHPAVDFDKQTLFAIVDSSQPNGGYYLSFDKIERLNDELWLYVTREQPGTECMNMGMIAQPYVIISIDKTDAPARLVFNTRNYPC